MTTFKDDFTALIRSGFPVIGVETAEEDRLKKAILDVAKEFELTCYEWTCTKGAIYVPHDDGAPGGPGRDYGDLKFHQVLMQLHTRAVTEGAQDEIWVLRDFSEYFEDHEVCRQLRDVTNALKASSIHVVLVEPKLDIPDNVKEEIYLIDFPLPDREFHEWLLRKSLASMEGFDPSDKEIEEIAEAAKGMTSVGAENAFFLSWIRSGKTAIRPEAVGRIKAQQVRKSGLLELSEPDVGLEDVGGMGLFKDWLLRRKDAFGAEAEEYGLDTPKGVLAIGVPGCGKSLMAKAVSVAYRRPLLRLDVGRLFHGLVGESEANQRRAFRLAEAVAPCVLWLDEIEKALAGSASALDSGVSARIFGGFLTWMAEKTAPVFVFATANDVTSLPPELSRKGRFDELFFVDLPSPEERRDIWRIHIEKRGWDPELFDLEHLSALSQNFSGSEIEEAVKEAMYTAWDDGKRPLKHGDVASAVREIVPLYDTRREDILQLREWAEGRARKASAHLSASRNINGHQRVTK